jgi:hypothetical protein
MICQEFKKDSAYGKPGTKKEKNVKIFLQFGFLVPSTHSQEVKLERINGNTKCQDAE